MEGNFHLLLHNVGSLVSGIVALALAIFTFFNNPKKTVNLAITGANISVAIFCFSHLIGTNVIDHVLSKQILMFNLSVIFAGVFSLHTVFAIIHKEKEKRFIIILTYFVGISMTIFFLVFPDTFLLDSVQKLYLPNYYNPGNYHWVFRAIFEIILPLYLMYELYSDYRSNPNPIESNRAKYFLFTVTPAYLISFIPVLLVFDIPIDPAWGIWFVPLYTIPLVYGIVTYELVDIKIIARKAFLYGVAIASVSGLIVLFNFINQYVESSYPGFPFWITPFVSSIAAVAIGVFVWKKMREGELLKYEFITVVTHKFRTPLTHIKWAAENLSKSNLSADDKTQLGYIEGSNSKLVELTNLLMNVSETENSSYSYRMERGDLSPIIEEVSNSLASAMATRQINIIKNIEQNIYTQFDNARIKFVIQVLMENAMHYTPEKGNISIALSRKDKDVVFSVRDTGIGIPKDEVPLLFSKFYRGHQAKLADTEGMGIGLFLSKEVIVRHHGRIWGESEGLNKGSTFSFSLPTVK